MDVDTYFTATHRRHLFGNAVSPAIIDRALAIADLKPGARCADLGAGNAAMSLHLAERYGLVVDAVERSAGMVAMARERVRSHPAGSAVTVHHTTLDEFLGRGGAYDLLVIMGVFGGPRVQSLAEALRSLSGSLVPGGRILYGDVFLRPTASDRLRESRPEAGGFADPVGAAEGAGLKAFYATESTQQDWDEYAWRIAASLDDYAREHPDEPGLDVIRARVGGMIQGYLAEAREHVGFGVYLFRS